MTLGFSFNVRASRMEMCRHVNSSRLLTARRRDVGLRYANEEQNCQSRHARSGRSPSTTRAHIRDAEDDSEAAKNDNGGDREADEQILIFSLSLSLCPFLWCLRCVSISFLLDLLMSYSLFLSPWLSVSISVFSSSICVPTSLSPSLTSTTCCRQSPDRWEKDRRSYLWTEEQRLIDTLSLFPSFC